MAAARKVFVRHHSGLLLGEALNHPGHVFTDDGPLKLSSARHTCRPVYVKLCEELNLRTPKTK